MLGVLPPNQQRGLLVWHRDRRVQPGEDVVPNLAREGAFDEEVVDGFCGLIAKRAPRVVLQSAACESISRPASVLLREPVEELDLRWRPRAPDHLPGAAGCGSLEGGEVAGLRRVGTRGRSPPDKAVGFVG